MASRPFRTQVHPAATYRPLQPQQLHWLLRCLWLSDRPNRSLSQPAGFVLPTITLVLLMLTLTVVLLITRTMKYSGQVVGQRQQRELYNATTPAIQRAQAKLEYLFKREPLPPLPSDGNLRLLLTDQAIRSDTDNSNYTYKLNDEEFLDLDGNSSTFESAWTFRFDADGNPNTGTNPRTGQVDGREVQVAYSILSQANGRNTSGGLVSFQNSDQEKVAAQVVRNGPISLQQRGANVNCSNLALAPRAGWQYVNSAGLRKMFQVNAFAKNMETGVAATMEFQQERQASLGNKWGAWFRYDLEAFPGPAFRWNGAMHTEGNLMLTHEGGPFNLFLVSSPASCIYSRDASEITISGGRNNNFMGHAIVGSMKWNDTADRNATIHRYADQISGNNPATIDLRRTEDSVTGITTRPNTIALDPILVQTEDRNRSRNPNDPTNTTSRDAAWQNRPLVQDTRVYNASQTIPFVDDTYRADNRWGPKPRYSTTIQMNSEDANGNGTLDTGEDTNGNGILDAQRTGDRILPSHPDHDDLVSETAPANSETDYGLDGYWERRASAQGVRVIVGQRLELGNMNGWINEDVNNNGTLDSGEDVNNNAQIDRDPLNPPPANAAADSSLASRPHEQRQWRTLRDNLAAVQSAAVYHYLNQQGRYPIACLAATSHPGTDITDSNSRTFNPLSLSTTRLNTDFLTGNGTNGIEFAPPFASASNPEAAFAAAIDTPTSPLRMALRNLAFLSGDPAGAFPAQQDVLAASANNAARVFANFNTADAVGLTHPYSQLTMWGNFSELRQIISSLKVSSTATTGLTYNELSPADRTTLHTASCTLGMLAYNLQNQEDIYQSLLNASGSGGPSLQAIGIQLFELMDGQSSNGEIGTDDDKYCKRNDFNGEDGCPSRNPYTVSNPNSPEHYTNYYAQFKPEDWVRALRSGNQNNHADRIALLNLVSQVRRDRVLGFARNVSLPGSGPGFNWQNGTYDLDEADFAGQLGKGNNEVNEATVIYYNVGCDPNSFPGLQERAQVGLAMAACPRSAPPRYPALYYLFPKSEHAHDGRVTPRVITNGGFEVPQPANEPYVNASTHPYIFDRTGRRGVNCILDSNVCANNTFRPVGDNNNDGVESTSETDGPAALLAQLGMAPRLNTTDWRTPITATETGRVNRITVNGTALYPAFLEKAFFNGREMMAVRSMDLDLDLLRRTQITGFNAFLGSNVTDYWLPSPTLRPAINGPTRTGALIYAFREDAMREDQIARPRAQTDSYANWLSNWLTVINDPSQLSTNYRMDAVSSEPNDPPINPRTGISPKAVDFYPDPDRRPNGFRLRNGTDLRRINGTSLVIGTDAAPEVRGLSFISDNPVYLEADNNSFNWHSEEEFTETLEVQDWNNFYTRSTLNTNFAGRNDRWRPTEIIADAVTILSSDFTEGTIARSILRSSQGSFNGLSGNERNKDANEADLRWVRENGFASREANYLSPIKFSERGFPIYCVNTSDNSSLTGNGPCNTGQREVEYGREFRIGRSNLNFRGINDGGNSGGTPDQTFINAVIVSGIVPSRPGQSFGGLHNFPRFLEDWDDLFISGSLMQLRFSNYATGTFDKDSWEPGTSPNSGQELISYYGAPRRFWGYDVALQYAPAGPISERFISISNQRSEFYQELQVDDPYIRMLRCARIQGQTQRIDQTATCS